MKKILLLDFDGVVSPGKYFSEIYAEKFDIDINVMKPFFEQMKGTANVGKADLKDLLKPVMQGWKWHGSVEELMEFWFNSDSDIDLQVIDFVRTLRKSGWEVYLTTDQEKYRADFIWNRKNLKDSFSGKLVSCDIGYHKSDPKFFEKVLESLKVIPQNIIFYDDSLSKVEAAKSVGIDARLYENFNSLRELL